MSNSAILPYKPELSEIWYLLLACLGISLLLLYNPGWFAPVSALVACSGAGMYILVRRNKVPVVRAGICMFLLGICLVRVWQTSQAFVEASQWFKKTSLSQVRFEALSDSSKSYGSYKTKALCCSKDVRHQVQAWLVSSQPLRYGDTFQLIGQAKPLPATQAQQVSAKGIVGKVQVRAITHMIRPQHVFVGLVDFRNCVLFSLEPEKSPTRALAAACVCGYKTALDRFGISDMFARVGLAHIVAVSGSHLALVNMLCAAAIGRLPLKPFARSVLLMSICGLFVLFCACPASALRSWCMTVVGQLSGIWGRRKSVLAASCSCAVVLILIQPTLATDIGFLLSLVSVLGLCIFSSYASWLLHELVGTTSLYIPAAPKKLMGILQRAFVSTTNTMTSSLVALWCTFPLTLALFKQLSLVAILANICIGPIFFIFMLLSFAVMGVVYVIPQLGFLYFVINGVGGFVLSCAQALANLPFACIYWEQPHPLIILGSAACMLIVLYRWPLPSEKALARARMVLGMMLLAAAIALCVAAL